MSIDKILGGGGGGGDGDADEAFDLSRQTLEKQKELLNKAGTIYEDLRMKGRSQMARWLKAGKPIEDRFLATARRGLAPDYRGITNMRGAASREVGRQFGIARQSLMRDLGRYGIAPGSGSGISALGSNALAEAAARAGAMTRANVEEQDKRREERRYAESETFKRRGVAAEYGAGRYDAGANMLSVAGNGLTAGAAAFGGISKDMRNFAQEQAQTSGGGLGDLIKTGIQIYGMTQGAPPGG
ncbi:MAG: hypothetical protein K2Y51_25950 [Gammaproteobacteria bacterium]|nr:hypothetical protein [Gammaproteobacteria bacterium]